MKILLVHNFYRTAGGEEHYVKSLARLLRHKGHQVFLYSKSNKTISERFIPRVRVSLSMFWNRTVYDELGEIIEGFKPDIAHFSNIHPLISPTAYHALKRKRIPIVQTIHNFRYLFPKSLLIRRGRLCPMCLETRLIYPSFIHPCYGEPFFYTASFSLSHFFHKLIGSFNLVDCLIFPSAFTKNYFLKNTGLNKERTVKIANFVEETSPLSVKRGNYFLYAGRLSPEKGILELLGLVSTQPKLSLVVIGDGPLMGEAKKYSHLANIRVLGKLSREKVLGYMKKAKATIIPSRCYEVLPTVLLESFSVGTPVVVPRIGVFKELVREGETGFLYAANKGSELGNLLSRLKGESLAGMRVKCRQEYLDKYRDELYYERIEKVYSRLKRK